MADYPALPLWTDALLGDTGHLTTLEFGAYVLMLVTAWRSPNCDLPDDEKQLGRITRLGHHFKRYRPALMAFWVQRPDGRWHQKRLTQERLLVAARSKSSSHAAKIKWLNYMKTNDPAAYEAQMRNGCGTDASIPILSPERDDGSNPSLPPSPDSERPRLEPTDREPDFFPKPETLPARVNGKHPAPAKRTVDLADPAWQPTGAELALIAAEGLDPIGTIAEIRDWAANAPAAKRRKRDIPAFLRTWCRRNPVGPSPRQKPQPDGIMAAAARVLAKFEEPTQ